MAMSPRDHLHVAATHLSDATLRLTDARCHLDNAIADGAIPSRSQIARVNSIARLIEEINELRKETKTWKSN